MGSERTAGHRSPEISSELHGSSPLLQAWVPSRRGNKTEHSVWWRARDTLSACNGCQAVFSVLGRHRHRCHTCALVLCKTCAPIRTCTGRHVCDPCQSVCICSSCVRMYTHAAGPSETDEVRTEPLPLGARSASVHAPQTVTEDASRQATYCSECDDARSVMICHQCAILLCEQCSSFHRRSRRTKHHVLSSGKGNSPGFHTARGVQTEGPSPEAIEASWRHKTESLEEAKLQAEQRVHDITCTLEKEHKNVLSLQQQLTLQKNQSAEEIDAAKAVSKAAHARIAELKSSLELEHECVLSLQEHLTALKDAHRTEVEELESLKDVRALLEGQMAAAQRALEAEQQGARSLRKEVERAEIAVQEEQRQGRRDKELLETQLASLQENVEQQRLVLLGAQEQEQERIELQKRFEEQRRLVLELQEEIGVKAKAIEALEERVALLSACNAVQQAQITSSPSSPCAARRDARSPKDLSSPDMAPGMRRFGLNHLLAYALPQDGGDAPTSDLDRHVPTSGTRVGGGLSSADSNNHNPREQRARTKRTRSGAEPSQPSPVEAALLEEEREWHSVVTKAQILAATWAGEDEGGKVGAEALFDDARSEVSACESMHSRASAMSGASRASCVSGMSAAATHTHASGGSRGSLERSQRRHAAGRGEMEGRGGGKSRKGEATGVSKRRSKGVVDGGKGEARRSGQVGGEGADKENVVPTNRMDALEAVLGETPPSLLKTSMPSTQSSVFKGFVAAALREAMSAPQFTANTWQVDM